VFLKIKEFVIKNKIIIKGDNIVAAVSGGADSVFLVNILLLLKKELEFNFTIAHFNHKLRKNASNDSLFVSELAKNLKIPFYHDAGNVAQYAKKQTISIEMAARDLRYIFLNKLIDDGVGNKIAVAHNLTDSLETVFINMSRGSGLRGISGIKTETGHIIRPLLQLTSTEIRDYMKENSIGYVEDESNKSDCFLRNRVRMNIIPQLINTFGINGEKSFFKTINQVSENTKTLNYLLKRELKGKYVKVNGCVRVKKSKICSYPSFLLKEIVVKFVEMINNSTYFLSSKIIEGICDFIKAEGYGKYEPSSKLGLSVIRSGDNIYILNDKYENKIITISSNGLYEAFPGITFDVKNQDRNCLKPNNKNYLYLEELTEVKLERVLRRDYMVINGKKKENLYKFMKKIGIGAFERNNFPVVKVDNEILWIPGFVYSDNVKISSSSNKLIEVYIHDLLR